MLSRENRGMKQMDENQKLSQTVYLIGYFMKQNKRERGKERKREFQRVSFQVFSLCMQ
jgi:hypothetical protein